MEATSIVSDTVDTVDTVAPRTPLEPQRRRHRYRISFADGSVGTRFYDEPLRVGQQIVDRGALHLVDRIQRQCEYGGIGRASAVELPAAVAGRVAA